MTFVYGILTGLGIGAGIHQWHFRVIKGQIQEIANESYKRGILAMSDECKKQMADLVNRMTKAQDIAMQEFIKASSNKGEAKFIEHP